MQASIGMKSINVNGAFKFAIKAHLLRLCVWKYGFRTIHCHLHIRKGCKYLSMKMRYQLMLSLQGILNKLCTTDQHFNSRHLAGSVATTESLFPPCNAHMRIISLLLQFIVTNIVQWVQLFSRSLPLCTSQMNGTNVQTKLTITINIVRITLRGESEESIKHRRQMREFTLALNQC